MLGIFYIAILGKELYKVGKELRKYLYDNKGDEKIMENILSNIIACLSVAGFAIGGYYLLRKGLAPVDEKRMEKMRHISQTLKISIKN